MHNWDNTTPQRIAVIGSGAAGLTATHLLQRKHHVTLYEKAERLGGHTNTITLSQGPDAGLSIDTGFIVMNHRNYPLLSTLFEQLSVPLQNSDMSFGYYDISSGLQYSGSGLNGLFAQRRNLFRPRFHQLIQEIRRFFSIASADAVCGLHPEENLGDYLSRHQFSEDFIQHHLIPMGSAIWSTPCHEMLLFPAQNFLTFFKNHGLLGISDRPQWRTVCGGSKTYLDKMQKAWQQVSIKTQAQVEGIYRNKDEVCITCGGHRESFDQVIIATHANQVLELLADAHPHEEEQFKVWKYAKSHTYLHSDPNLMPPLRRIWSSWNFQRVHDHQTSLTYYMNRLQNLDTKQSYFVTLDPPSEPKEIHYQIEYEHPMFTRDALVQREKLIETNGLNRTWYAGAYMGNGFHEDAVRSAAHIAAQLGCAL